MTELGRAAVWVALVAATAAAVSPLVGRAHRAPRLLAVAAAGAVVATAVLARALVVGDYSLVYVADFGRRDASAPFRLAGLWGGMAGSLLWLATLVALAGLVATRALATGRTGPARPAADPDATHEGRGEREAGNSLAAERDAADQRRSESAADRCPHGSAADRRRAEWAAAVVGAVVAVLVGLVLGFADPFTVLDVPALDGAGLTPILEHPAMLYHPPLLYLGLATLVGPFALTVTALVEGRLDDAWLATARRWSLVPWTLLGVGMVAGAHWAYVELGWGGYWAWDPVENTALLPWLAVTVFLHGARGTRTDRPPVSRVAVAGLACLPFVLALLGSLLTRSGATSSVHAFAESRAIGRALAVAVAATTLAVAGLLARAARRGGAPSAVDAGTGASATTAAAGSSPRPTAAAGASASRPPARGLVGRLVAGPGVIGRLIAGHLVVVGAALAVVLAGTLWPLWADLRGGDGVAVEGAYFAQFVGPMAGAGLALVCLVPTVVVRSGRSPVLVFVTAGSRGHRRQNEQVPASPRLVGAAGVVGAGAAVALLAACAPTLRAPQAVLAATAGAGAASALVGAVVAGRRRFPVGGHLAHAALALTVLGVAGTASGGARTVPVLPGDTVSVLGHEVAYGGLTVADGPVRGSSAVVAEVTAAGQELRPSLVAYPDRGVLLAETSLRSRPAVDVQVTLRTAQDDGRALLEVGVHPLQMLVWWGGLAVVAAGAVATREAFRRPVSPEVARDAPPAMAPASPA